MGFMIVHGHCIACKNFMAFNASFVPSIPVKGVREPVCKDCFNRWNEIHRTSKDLEPLPIHPDAYEPEEVN